MEKNNSNGNAKGPTSPYTMAKTQTWLFESSSKTLRTQQTAESKNRQPRGRTSAGPLLASSPSGALAGILPEWRPCWHPPQAEASTLTWRAGRQLPASSCATGDRTGFTDQDSLVILFFALTYRMHP